jgi:DNA uptake protein ComE-like DNA-binding protein
MSLRHFAVLSVAVAGCAISADLPNDPDATPSVYAATLSPSDSAAVLALVNYPGTDVDLLDTQVGLDSRAARGIIAHRNGADGIAPSSDDVPFTTIADLDAIPYVGDSAFTKLTAWADAHPQPAPETVEGVAFAGWESQSVVWGVNNLDRSVLDGFLDARAATGLVAKRPFTSVAQMGPVAYVGTAALRALHDHAQAWWALMRAGSTADLAGVFDGVSFDEPTAEVALQIANLATQAQLTGNGVNATGATKIVAARSYTTLAAVAAVGGVGTATMRELHDYATSGTWSTCTGDFIAAVAPHLPPLLFLSESDRPFDIVVFPGAGTSAPTAASVLALVDAEAGSTALLRSPDDYFTALEPEDSPDAAAVQAAYGAQLTDVVYVAVFKPESDPYNAEVDVYLVGRTACGDLVGIHAISIET